MVAEPKLHPLMAKLAIGHGIKKSETITGLTKILITAKTFTFFLHFL
jgi:hypothetical protein